MACVDMHAKACERPAMHDDILSEVEQFARDTGLSDHRVGILLANNGRLIERLRNPSSRVWPETVARIRAAIDRERRHRAAANKDHFSAPPAADTEGDAA